ncbi:MAG: MarR family winged helix-turn-helix transcriptional regulator [Candidatus Puniceispirillaceae bacterium]
MGSQQRYDLSTILTFRLSRLQASLNAQAADLLRRHGGVPLAHWRVMLLLYDNLASTQKEIVELAAFDKGQVSRIVDRLIEEKLVVSESDVDDKRVRKLQLTPAAQQMLGRLIPLMRQRQEHLASVFEQGEMAQLFEYLERLDKVSGKLSL